jgi:hypothetical protein
LLKSKRKPEIQVCVLISSGALVVAAWRVFDDWPLAGYYQSPSVLMARVRDKEVDDL